MRAEVEGERGGAGRGNRSASTSPFLCVCIYNFESALYLAFGASVREAGVVLRFMGSCYHLACHKLGDVVWARVC